MVIKIKNSFFEVLKNTREALNLEQLNTCYIEEYYDAFPYIVGDISDQKLRLKQFSTNKDSKDYFHKIPDYLLECCTYKPAFFILHRIDEDAYLSRRDEAMDDTITSGDVTCLKMEKQPYDKENLSLEKTEKNVPIIKINMERETAVNTYPLPEDIAKEIQKEKQMELRNRQNKNQQSKQKNARPNNQNSNNNNQPVNNQQNKNNNWKKDNKKQQ